MMAAKRDKYIVAIAKRGLAHALSRATAGEDVGAGSVAGAAAARRCEIFSAEQERQRAAVGRHDKIEVRCRGRTLLMNRLISTPFHVAQHISGHLAESSALALVDGAPHDLHRPLEASCELALAGYTEAEPRAAAAVAAAFWRACSLLLGAVLQRLPCRLHSFPPPNVSSGSFVYDVEVLEGSTGLTGAGHERGALGDEQLRALSASLARLARANSPLERLVVTETLAADMFSDNPHKASQIPSIAAKHGGVCLYRVCDAVDISVGPAAASSGQVGRATVAAAHLLPAHGQLQPAPGQLQPAPGQLLRVQGVALPAALRLDHFAYSILERRAAKLNTWGLRGEGAGGGRDADAMA